MNVADIIKKYLREIGADGLCNPEQECGCGIDDMEPCDVINISDCVPAKRVKCTEECEHEGGPPYDYHYEAMEPPKDCACDLVSLATEYRVRCPEPWTDAEKLLVAAKKSRDRASRIETDNLELLSEIDELKHEIDNMRIEHRKEIRELEKEARESASFAASEAAWAEREKQEDNSL